MNQNKPHLFYLVFDWETGGLSSKKNPVVELAMIALRADNFEEIGRIDNIIVPYDKKGQVCDYDLTEHLIKDIDKKSPKEDQDAISEINSIIEEMHDFVYTEGAMNVHGVTESDFIQKGIEPIELVNKLVNLASEAKVNNFSKAVLVGHNPDFDRNFMQQIFEVTGKTKEMPKLFAGSEDHYGNFQPHMIDTIDLAKLAWHKNEEEITNYKLETCIAKAKLDLVGAHRAMNDVVATKDLLLFFKKKLRSDNISQSNESRFRENFTFEV